MASVRQILQDLKARRDATGVTWYDAADWSGVVDRFAGYSQYVPDPLRDLYLYTDGLELGTFRILPIAEIMWPELSMCSIHIWGNGDVDCVHVPCNEQRGDPPVFFMGHDPQWTFRVSESFSEWLESVIEEYLKHGFVLSPWDCYMARARRTYFYI